MPSVSRSYAGVLLSAGLALVICGCTTTQTTAARLRLSDSRLRAEAQSVRVTAGETSTAVTVASRTFLSQHADGTAQVAVSLENHTAQAVSDLPISVGYVRGSHTVYLNGAAGQAYFDDHIPSIRAHGSLTWVSGAVKQLPRGARTFVRVGAEPSIAVGRISTPVIRVVSTLVRDVRTKRPSAGVSALPSLRISVTNTSSITQYQLPVYAVVTQAGRVVAADDRSVADLAAGAKAVLHVPFVPPVGAGASSIRVQAPATIFK